MNIQPKHSHPLILSGRDVTAVLGPTNTGKTHLAIERMVAHETGVIGLPLRLLAREVYARVCEKVGAHKVALITGEEKIVPAGARYSVCTVEAMPRETDAAFVAIDEVQLAGDLERGHIFTDRILHLRGRQETLLLGAATMHGILQRLLKGVSVVTRPRLSHLAYAGSKKLTRLPRRTAIVAFSADEVYAIAELIRRQQGGAAVVLGALSPRTRNAQVEIFQSGDVDYLVATDAIGMGLNLDLDHVAFAQNRKFDGYQYRNLTAAELGQIAGRAGRHLRDGTFGVTGQVDPFDEELVAKIEGHDFDPAKVLQWRTADFDFSSLDALKRSIEANAPVEGLTRALPAVDAQALEQLSRDGDIRGLATGKERVALLWEACALPDYRKIAPAQHADLIASIYMDLARHGHVDENYMAEQVRRADTTEGDIDTLSHRIAQIRTWTFVSNRPGWLADQLHWQEKTREIEDRLSDALHERLTKRFVDRRTSVLMRRLRENTMPEAEISPSGTVLVEGHHVGELQGFRFTADQSAGGEDAKAVRTAAQKALAAEFEARAERFAACANGDLALGSDGVLRWIGAPIGTLVAADEALKPRLVLLADEQLTGPARDKVAARAERFVNFQIETLLKPLVDLKNADQLAGIARGIAFQLVEHFGLINRRDIAEEMKSLDQEGRAALRRLGVRFGAYHVFVPALIKPAPAGLVTLLWALKNDGKDKPGFGDVVHALASGRTSVVIDPAFDKTFYKLAGYRNLGRRAVRVDILERLADLIRPATNWKPGLGQRPDGAYDGHAFMVTPPMMSILGATADDMEEILKGLGYRSEAKPAAEVKAKLDALDDAAREAAAAKLAADNAARAAREAEAQAAATDTVAEATVESSEPAAAEAPAEAVAEVAVEPATAEPAEAPAAVTEEAAAVEDAAAVDIAAAPESAESADALTSPHHQVEGSAGGEAPAEAEEPKPVLLWRQARFDHQRPRHRHDNRRDNRPRGAQPARETGAASGQPGDRPAQEGRREQREGAGKPRFDRSKFKPRPETGDRREGAERREGKPQGERREGRPDWKGGRQDGKGNAPGGKPAFQGKPREERPQRFDPDSPFAKLAALRDQLKK
ncbi:helicase [Mesorhizobium sp. CA18]|uniref:helicase-related protein n=1 Tax=unclassified Mesorhizobium TaxID=325217 RepID=UPI001CCB20A1|nr:MULTISPECIES: helicase-related protein [unclassified Mesorhizobium]MBZ9735834.1 helicase [Mesorhizobium sp. CA9]MBZ9826715.1 helicase [Mesorhizobium sp. CA18]MBZ9833394.1 helicase [Mesorhizobium sp. CA2]MBZ9838289.1 helicase [Mesorhizobium sp. CA3]MBZ9879210.1 helicase [Mesorhizobium sp. Ca11]